MAMSSKTSKCCASVPTVYAAGSSLTDLLNPDKSEAIIVGTHQQRHAAATVQTVPVAGVNLPIAPELKSLGVIIDSQISFDSHIGAVCRSCNFHIRALTHIRHLLPMHVAHT